MTDDELFTRLRTFILSNLDAYGIPVTVEVIQAMQERQGNPDASYITMYKLPERMYAPQSRRQSLNNDQMVITETQMIETPIQFNGVMIDDDYIQSGLTSSDLVARLQVMLQSFDFTNYFRQFNASFIRITDIQNTYSENENDGLQNWPSLDCTIQHSREIMKNIVSTDVINPSEDLGIYPIKTGL